MAQPSNFYAQPMYNEPISAVTATNSVLLGSVRMEGGEEYLYVYNDGASAQASIGRAVGPQSGSSGYSVTVSSVVGVFGAMGVVKHATLTTSTYGWILTKGYVSTLTNGMASTAIVSGSVLSVGDNGAFVAATGAQTCAVQGYAINATGSAGVFAGFLRCFGT